MATSDVLADYDKRRALYDEFRVECKTLVRKLLREAGLEGRIADITSRPKEMESLERKLGASEKEYAQLGDVTDLAGVRVVTYFADDVDRVAQVIEDRFPIDKENSIDKRRTLAPDAFGYLSVHYVCSLSDERRELPENARFSELYVEIQIRSILQHAWAEIEHDLGYKSLVAVPTDYRRRFARLAGLLEMADEEFMSLRNGLGEYAAGVADEISRQSATVLIDKDSLTAFVTADPIVRKADSDLAAIWGRDDAEEVDSTYLQSLIPIIQQAGFSTIDDIRSALERDLVTVVEQARQQRKEQQESSDRPVPRGVSLFRLSIVVLARIGVDAIVQAIDAAGWRLDVARVFAEQAVMALSLIEGKDSGSRPRPSGS